MASATAELIIEATAKTDEASTNLRSLSDTFALVSTAAGIVGTAIMATGAALVSFAQQADEQNRQIQRLAFALEGAGLNADKASARLENMFTQMSRISGISDEELREATTQFATFAGAVGVTTREVEKASMLIVDIAAQTGKSASRISRQVADAFAGNAEALTAINPALREAAEEIAQVESAAERGRRAMAALEEMFGGAATAAAGAGVNMRVLSNELGDLRQSIGNQVLASGEFQSALRTVLRTVRDLDRQMNDPRSGLSETVRNLGTLFSAAATAINFSVPILNAWYNTMVAIGELAFNATFGGLITIFDALVTPIKATYTALSEGLAPAIDVVEAGFERVGRRISQAFDAFSNAATSVADFGAAVFGIERTQTVINEIGESVEYVNEVVEDSGALWRWLGDTVETQMTVAQRAVDDYGDRAMAVFERVRDFALGPAESPDRPRGPSGPSEPEGPTAADEAAKVKETATLLQAERDAAAQAELESLNAQKEQMLADLAAAEEARLLLEFEAGNKRKEQAEELARQIRDAEIAAAEEALAEQERIAQKRANIASQAANLVVGSLDAIASGEEKSAKERRKAIGTTLAAAGRGYILQAIPEAFINPVRAAGLAAGGAGLVAFGAALGGRVFGGGGGGGGSSPAAVDSAPANTGLNVPTAPQARQPIVANDFRNVTIVTDDIDTMRGFIRRADDARASGLGGVA